MTDNPELWTPAMVVHPVEDIRFEYETGDGVRWMFELPAERLLLSPLFTEPEPFNLAGWTFNAPGKLRGLRIWAPVLQYRIAWVPE